MTVKVRGAKRLGPTGKRLAANVRQLREERRLTTGQLADRLDGLGTPIPPTSITRLEKGDTGDTARHATADELVALGAALEVTPNRLLLPGTAGDDLIGLCPNLQISASDAWSWACGEATPPSIWTDRDPISEVFARRAFREQNHPHEPPADLSFSRISEHKEVLNALQDAADAAQEAGFSRRELAEFIRTRFRIGPTKEASGKRRQAP